MIYRKFVLLTWRAFRSAVREMGTALAGADCILLFKSCRQNDKRGPALNNVYFFLKKKITKTW